MKKEDKNYFRMQSRMNLVFAILFTILLVMDILLRYKISSEILSILTLALADGYFLSKSEIYDLKAKGN
jgi:ABC-type uncharacterized transport system fused permease/ATPase subunit